MIWNNGHEFVTAYWYALIYSLLISIWQRWLPFGSLEVSFLLCHWTLTPFDIVHRLPGCIQPGPRLHQVVLIKPRDIFGVGCTVNTFDIVSWPVFKKEINASVYHTGKPLGVERVTVQRRGEDGRGDGHDVASCDTASFLRPRIERFTGIRAVRRRHCPADHRDDAFPRSTICINPMYGNWSKYRNFVNEQTYWRQLVNITQYCRQSISLENSQLTLWGWTTQWNHQQKWKTIKTQL